MTEQQFINIDPTQLPLPDGNTGGHGLMFCDFTSGVGSQTLVERVVGISYPYTSLNDVNIYQTTYGVTHLTIDIPVDSGSLSGVQIMQKDFIVTGTVRRPSWVYLRLQETVESASQRPKISTYSELGADCEDMFISASNDPFPNTVHLFCSSSTIFEPFVSTNFENSDNNPLLSNATVLRKAKDIYEVNRYEDALIPTNLDAIIDQTATLANLQDSNYTDTGWTNARYEGTENNIKDLDFRSGPNPYLSPEPPAFGVKPFKAEVFELTATAATMESASKSERTVETLYFSPTLTKASGEYTYNHASTAYTGSYPASNLNHIVYREDNKRLVRLSNRKFIAIEEGTAHTTDESGTVI